MTQLEIGQARLEENLTEFRHETNQRLTQLETGQARLEEKLAELSKETNQRLTQIDIEQARLQEKLAAVEQDVKELKGTTKNQLWSLIVLLAGTLLTSVRKSLFFPNPEAVISSL